MVKLNNQTFYNNAVLHLFNQGQPAINDMETCLYRTKDGLKCVVGAVLPDSVFDKHEELLSVPVAHLKAYSLESRDLLSEVNAVLLREMQGLHDKGLPRCCGESGVWRFKLNELQQPLEELAKKFGLDTNVFSPYQGGSMTVMHKRGMHPPHRGWWSTETKWDETPVWRWWNGKVWSLTMRESMTPAMVELRASMPSPVRKIHTAYSNYWPENARVPRLNPDVPL